jgi:transcriptional regulator with XRE-family HTH domain
MQNQLGEKIGVQKSQISRLEKGRSVSLSSMACIFRTMNIPFSLELPLHLSWFCKSIVVVSMDPKTKRQ